VSQWPQVPVSTEDSYAYWKMFSMSAHLSVESPQVICHAMGYVSKDSCNVSNKSKCSRFYPGKCSLFLQQKFSSK